MLKKIKEIFTILFSKKQSVETNAKPIKVESAHSNFLETLDYEQYSDFKIVEEDKVAESENIEEKIKIFNPLAPYDANVGISKFSEELYVNQGRPFTNLDYVNIFKKHISIKNFLNEEKSQYLKKIWEDALYVNEALSILSEFNIKYTLDLTGGSVRDFVLNNHEKIKDLDFMVNIHKELIPVVDIECSGFFSKEELEKVQWSRYDNTELMKSKLVQLCFNRIHEDIIVFEHSDNRRYAYAKDRYGKDLFRKDRLISVIKLGGKKTHYPVDILLTDFAKPEFLKDFDFDICKASFCFVNPHVNKKFPSNYSYLISRFVAENNFWADVFNNTCTYNTVGRTVSQMNSSFESHFPRIKEKYPKFKLLILGEKDKVNYARDLSNKIEMVNQLEEELKKKQTEPIVKKKVKI